MSDLSSCLKTPLFDLHQTLGGKLVPFAGYALPVSYPAGVLREHLHTRAQASLFDVSHMGQVVLGGAGRVALLEALTPGAFASLGIGRQRYTVFTNDHGGILDDLMVSNRGDDLFVVVNAACKAADFALLEEAAPRFGAHVTRLEDRALLALQGPEAVAVIASLDPGVLALPFMGGATLSLDGVACFVTRSGYTGEDGVEISVPAEHAAVLARRLLDDPRVAPAGLGARDSLRLEAGLCLYGADLDQTITPIEAGLAWVVGKERRAQGGFPGAAVILEQLAHGPARRRVGLAFDERTPVRPPAEVLDGDGRVVGHVTSGGFAPSLDAPVAIALVEAAFASLGQALTVPVRGKPRPARVVPMPFVPHHYARPAATTQPIHTQSTTGGNHS
ncbi:glycine cleavage system aminomethyltransferase GcvT [Pararhodospirillum photometricum]|uniref:glycine cleavage system aminomethyltransferase GcvT n=1 Tax=Pararhodospirillum photometricum TaxID=1084 RepID=UPI000687AC28|nr:glycine cleavage system aminomethyltransferase GcvT [Pararhodospirillum photometricum]